MENYIMLPLDLINRILIMRPTHPVGELIQFCDSEYWYFYGDFDYNPEDHIFEVDVIILHIINL